MKNMTNHKTEQKNPAVREGVLYLIFGVLTTLVDYVISNGLYYVFHISAMMSQTVAWIAAVLFAFVVNKWWVFESRTLEAKAVFQEFTSFVVCRIATFLLNLAAIYVMVDVMELEFFISKIFISGAVIVLNYIFSKLFIFAKKKGKENGRSERSDNQETCREKQGEKAENGRERE